MSTERYHAAVFGATSAIAIETMRALAAERPAHFLLMGRNHDRLETIANDLRQRGAECDVATVDLLNPDEDWKQRLDGTRWDLFYIAHGSLPDQAETLADRHAIGREIDINFISPARIMSVCASILEDQQQGTLAVIGSVAGDRGRQSNYLYGSTKAALATFTGGMRHQFAGTPTVKVVLLKPGMTDTPMAADLPKGPLFSSAEKVGHLAWRAIRKGKAVAYLPSWWWVIMNIIRHLPRLIFHKTSL
ncbi:SDR family NAD(P)-dependent oxidoreductase [Haloferula rosea]|uniref:SDR family NAD(P)-dependent oxidoreductase n=1 Tax=Haloferula rosea TaxID=490093 RepID=A0A934REQ9_9BACT|nr:SDR family NAD(P)-dependent oxidoreductase [Haloferula rosea]MBK1827055.1 SDR family NAD(P)-dependent oxidoreductase [Haloferula rosea]